MLSTTHKSRGGWPYGSLVTVAFDCDMSPLMLFSTLSDHTRNLAVDPRASLLFEETSRLKNSEARESLARLRVWACWRSRQDR